MLSHRSALHRAIIVACAAVVLSLFAASDTRAALVYALTDENDLLGFDSATPGDLTSAGAISGLGGQDLIGIDFRPANGVLYGVGNLGGVFSINTTTRAATLVSTLAADPADATAPFTSLSGSRYGVDFNPLPDRMRIVSDLDQNLRVNVDTGLVTTDTNLTYAAGQPGATGDNPSVTGAAYTNSFTPSPRPGTGAPGDPGTTLYDIDVRADEDRLAIQAPPNDGTLTVVGPLGINASALLGFDIYISDGANVGLAAMQLTDEGTSNLYAINLTTGAASLIGEIGGGDLLDGLAVVPEPGAASLLALGAAGVLVPRRRRTA